MPETNRNAPVGHDLPAPVPAPAPEEIGAQIANVEDVAQEIAAELGALIQRGAAAYEGHAITGTRFYEFDLGSGTPGHFVADCGLVLSQNRYRNEAIITAWVQAECVRRGWAWDAHYWPDYEWPDGEAPAHNICITADGGVGWDILGEVTERHSLALAALRALRTALEAEVQHA